ncbi:PA14 domain-containing protein [Termitidicoccus mucosus]
MQANRAQLRPSTIPGPRFDMRLLRFPLSFAMLFCAAVLSASAQSFSPVASGPLGDVTTRDGDSAFDVFYFAAPDFAGEPVMTRFEARIASDTSAIAASIPAGRRGSVRWSATITPKRSGVFPLSLRATGAAVLKIDGVPVISRPASDTGINSRSTGSAELLAGRPYEFVVEFPGTDAQGQIALEWAQPAAAGVQGSADKNVRAPASAAAETTAGPRPGERIGEPARLENAAYALDSQADGTLVVTQKSTGARAEFAPEFIVVFQPRGREAKLDRYGGKYLDDGPVGNTSYRVVAWEKETDFLAAAKPRARLRASRVTREGGALRWAFPAQPGYTLSATVTAPADGTEPALAFRLDATAPGQVSVGYAGAPATGLGKADWIWQPLVWQEKRFPNRSYLTLEYQCPIGFAMTGLGGDTIAVGADARELPFRMPTAADSRFGILVRNAAGLAQPMLFAPVLGGAGSSVEPGASRAFMLRLVARRGAWFENYRHLATSLYGFRDVRENVLCSLNTTLENLADFVLNDRFCYWYPKYKTWGYQNDAGPDAGRQQSAADALSLALVLDRAEMLRRRAIPTVEYMLSRKTNQAKLTDPKIMGTAFRYPVDLVAAWRLTGGRAMPIREKITPGLAGKKPAAAAASSWAASNRALLNHLAAYRLTGDKAFLDAAREAADRYIAARIDRPVESFRGAPSSFWPDIAPSYDHLYELYGATGDPRYLRAAAAAMREITAFAYLAPVPDTDFVANPGGIYNGQPVPEETVPAWVVSANGLAAECAATSHSHRGIFMSAYFAGYMTRLGFDAREPFFTDIARNAVVGRYANYPSYAYRNGYTTLHQKPDFPLRTFEEIKKFTSAHYNHPLPMAAFLVDYIVADTYARSAGQIDFPSEYTYSGAYFRNKTYGNRPGKFLGDDGVFLWMPKGLVSVDSIQLNYLSARGNGKLYLAFSNQSARPVSAAIAVNPDRAAVAGAHRARVWHFPDLAHTGHDFAAQRSAGIPARDSCASRDIADRNVRAPSAAVAPEMLTVTDGRAAIEVAPKGLTCVVIDDVAARTEIQDAMLDPRSPPLPAGATVTAKTPFGPATATALRFGRGLTTVHVWLEAAPPAVGKAVLRYQSDDGKTAQLECSEFPFEFTVPVSDAAKDFRCTIEAVTPKGPKTSPELRIRLQ